MVKYNAESSHVKNMTIGTKQEEPIMSNQYGNLPYIPAQSTHS